MDHPNFKELWKNQPSSTPDIATLNASLNTYKRKNLRNMILAFASQLIPIIVCILIWIYYDSAYITTKLGLSLIIVGILLFLFNYSSFLSNFQRINTSASNKEHLQNLSKQPSSVIYS